MVVSRPTLPRPATKDAVRVLRSWHAALMTVFFATGIGVATWVTRTPAVRNDLGASLAEMGLVIAGLSVGSFVGISLGATLVARLGPRFVVVAGVSALAAGLTVMAMGAVTANSVVVAAGLALFGYGVGSGEIGNNVSGVELEAAAGRSIVPGLHGCFSLGTVVGAIVGLGANRFAIPVLTHLLVVAALVVAVAVWIRRHIPGPVRPAAMDLAQGHGPDKAPEESSNVALDAAPAAGVGAAAGLDGGPSRPRRWAWIDSRLVGAGVIILGMALAEGSATDWLPLIVVDGFGSTAEVGAGIYAFFGAAMAIGRLRGGRFIDRFGRAAVMRVSAIVGTVGIVTVVVVPNLWLAAAGVLLWGIGASLGFPVALSAAGDDPRYAAKRASLVATAGYAAFLIGPPLLGFLGEHVGIRAAMTVVAAMVAITTFFAGSVASRAKP